MKLQVVELEETSETAKILVVVPTGNAPPLGNPDTKFVVVAEQLSIPVGAVKLTFAAHIPGLLGTAMLAGQVAVGASLSFTVTVKLHVVELPLPSVTLKMLLVTPIGNTVPLF